MRDSQGHDAGIVASLLARSYSRSITRLAVLATSLLACTAEPDAAGEEGLPPPEEDAEDPCVPGPNPSLEIGEGELEYLPFADGAMIELIHGPQGGVHTLTGLVARDIDARGDLDGVLRGYLGDEQVGGSYPFLEFRCKADEGQQVWGVFLFWDIAPELLHMQTVRIEVDVTDASGKKVTASKQAVIFDPTL